MRADDPPPVAPAALVPVAQSQGHAGKALAIAAVAIVLMGVLLWFAAVFMSGRDNTDLNLGDERFNAGQTDRQAHEIDDSGGLPILYPDLVGKDRPIFVQHVGEEEDEGWLAFGAFDPDDPTCIVALDREAKVLFNECDESVTYPLDGKGLRQYPVSVEDGRIYVDVNELTTSTTAD